jgi:hypothetical protein
VERKEEDWGVAVLRPEKQDDCVSRRKLGDTIGGSRNAYGSGSKADGFKAMSWELDQLIELKKGK